MRTLTTNAWTALLLILATLAGDAIAQDGPPRKMPLGRFSKLWTDSPFTTPPPPGETVVAPSVLDDYTLAGVSPVGGGYSVVLINKKEPGKRVHLLPGLANEEGFEVKSVRQDPIQFKNTTVEIAVAGGKTGRVGYDDKYLALSKPAAAARTANNNAQQQAGKQPAANANANAQQAIPGLNQQQQQQQQQRTNQRSNQRSDRGNDGPRVRRVPTPPRG